MYPWILQFQYNLLVFLLAAVFIQINYVENVKRPAVDDPVVKIGSGRVKGRVLFALDQPKPVYAFLGIPYATPPVGKLRFQPAKPPTPWKGVKSAQEYGENCPQNVSLLTQMSPLPPAHTRTSEDCLYVNVFTSDLNASRPVLVYFHGGGLQTGSGSAFDGTVLVTFEDIVVITLNYRLGILGFLSTEDVHAPTNMGMRDQQMALQWVKDNIAAFGGNSHMITIAGHEAGAWSVGFHLLATPMGSMPVFQRAVSMGGGMLLNNRTSRDVRRQATIFASMFECDNSNSERATLCLRKTSVHDVISAQSRWEYGSFIWNTAIDRKLLPVDPVELYKNGSFYRVPHLGLLSTHEGILLAERILSDLHVSPSSVNLETAHKVMTSQLHRYYDNNFDMIYEKVEEFYISKGKHREKAEYLWKRLVELLGEMLYEAPLIYQLRLHSEYVPSYLGIVTHRPQFSPHDRWVSGSASGQDQVYVWGAPLMEGPVQDSLAFTPQDIHISRTLMKYLANFVKTGNPNGGDLLEWPEFTEDEQQHLEVKASPSISGNYKKHVTDFWSTTVASLAKRPRPKHLHSEL